MALGTLDIVWFWQFMGILMWWVVACDYMIVYDGLLCNYELHRSTLSLCERYVLRKVFVTETATLVKTSISAERLGGDLLFFTGLQIPQMPSRSVSVGHAGPWRPRCESDLALTRGCMGTEPFWVDLWCLAPACFCPVVFFPSWGKMMCAKWHPHENQDPRFSSKTFHCNEMIFHVAC